jgi:hypothetical protein
MHQPARMTERGVWSFLLACLLWCAASSAAWAQINPAEVTQLRVERTDEGVLLSAAVRFELPQAVEDALEKGIPMYFVAEAAIYRDRWYWYDKRVAFAVRHMRLAYQPLTRRWRLQVSSGPIGSSGMVLGQIFDSEDEALAAIRRISHWRIADAADIDPEASHNIDFRFRLDVSQLPRPFQIGAVGQADWIILAVRNQRLAFDHTR